MSQRVGIQALSWPRAGHDGQTFPGAPGAKPVPEGRELGGDQQISAGFGAISAGAGAGEKSGPFPLKGRTSPSWGGICIKNQSPTMEFGPSRERMQCLVGEEGVAITAPPQRPSRPALLPRPAPSCSFAAAPRSIFALTSASSLQPPLRHAFTTNFNVLLPPRGSYAGPCLHSSPRG